MVTTRERVRRSGRSRRTAGPARRRAARQRGLVNLGPQRATAVDRRLNSKLDAHAKTFGFKEMTCLWREAVDGATPEIKRQYAEMHRAPA
jgi:hypothetical protein